MRASRKKWSWIAAGVALPFLAVALVWYGGSAFAAAGTLTLSLEPSLDGGGDVKAPSITKAELLSTAGAVVKTATLKAGAAQFDLSSVKAGDYFIRVNGLAADLVPTRIDDPTTSVTQFVGKKLRATVIGSVADPTYRLKTYSKGQQEHAVVKYSNGSNATPERYAYVVLSLKTTPQKIEVRTLGTAALLSSYSPASPSHPGPGTPAFASYILGGKNHGKDENYGGTDTKCNTCHGNLDTRAAQFKSIATNNGWCFRCHAGKGGDPKGFVDQTQ